MSMSNEKLCFVLMPFHPGMKQVYTDAIKPACEKANFKPLRADELIGHYNIHRDIIKYIFSSDVIIVDLTGWNPNVFYEMGVAHTLDNKTMMIIQEGEKLPFDISNYRCIYYDPSEQGLKILTQKIFDYLQTADSWRQHPTNPVQEFKPHKVFVPKKAFDELNIALQKKDELLATSLPKADWDVLQLKFAAKQNEVIALQNEVEQLRAQFAQQAEKPPVRISLRSRPLDGLTGEAVKAMLKKYDFFCADYDWTDEWSNPDGKGIVHQFERRKEVVFDDATGLTWPQSGSKSYMTYMEAEEYIGELNGKNFAGHNDWRSPTLEEAMSLMEREKKKQDDLYIAPVFDKIQRWIWTVDKGSADSAWVVVFPHGNCSYHDLNYNAFVRVVRREHLSI